MPEIATEDVWLNSGNIRLAGHLFHSRGQPAPGVLVVGSWTTVKEQMADLYARKLAAEGFTTLTIDFANFGASEGEPREQESPSLKIANLIAAAAWLADCTEVTRGQVGGLAICASAGYMAQAIARGAPIGAFVTVAAWLHDAETVGEMYGGDDGVAQRISAGEEALRHYRDTGEVRYVPAYSDSDPDAAMGETVKSYYGDPAKGAVPQWSNRFAVLSWPEWLRFDGLASADAIGVPTLMIHSEEAAFPDNARRFEAALAGPSEILWREGTQLDFYSEPAQVDPAVKAAAKQFGSSLG